ncbi:MAG: discoidin domain-containing protein [Pirellulaceae bacterium]
MILCFATVVTGAAPVIRADLPNTVTFASQPAKFVRFVIHASSANQPCIDELEVYDTDGKLNFAGAERGAIATASSCLAGYPQHTIEHLNDGRYGNDFSWIAAGSSAGSLAGLTAEWAQIELPEATVVSKVVFSRDRERQYADRVPIEFEVLLSMDGERWKTAKRVAGTLADIVVRSPSGAGGNIPSPPPPPRLDRPRVALRFQGRRAALLCLTG